jgi:carbon storage regulator
MLVLSRKVGEKLMIGENITVVVSRVSGNRVTLGVEAPANVRIVRGELHPKTSGVNDVSPSALFLSSAHHPASTIAGATPQLAK